MPAPDQPVNRHRRLTAVAIVVLAVSLRPALASVGPVTGELRHDLGLSSTLVALATTLPLLCFACTSPAAPRLADRFGGERLLLGAAGILAVATVVRPLLGTGLLLGGTVVVGAAIAVGNVLLPALVKRDFTHHLGLMTGLYSMSIAAGAALGAALTIPAERWGGFGWRGGLAVWAVPPVAAAAVWSLLDRRTGGLPRGSQRERATALIRDPLAWCVLVFFGLQSVLYYSQLSWLPEIYQAAGESRDTSGLLLAVVQLAGIPAALALPWLASRRSDQRPHVLFCVVCTALGLAGLLVWPARAPYLWAVLLGVGGAAFPLVLALFGLRARNGADAGALSGMAQGGGYLIAASGPVVVGALHDASGGWTMPIVLLLALLVPMAAAGWVAGQDRYVGG